MPWSSRLVLLLVLIGLGLPTAASAQTAPAPAVPDALAATASVAERGWIRLRLSGPAGASVRLDEITGGVVRALGTIYLGHTTAGRKHFAPWRCDRLRRTFAATITQPDGTEQRSKATVTTPGCRNRLDVAAIKGRAGRRLTVVVRDRFLVGDIVGTVCISRSSKARKRTRCRKATIAAGETSATVRFAALSQGAYRTELRTAFGQRKRERFRVRPRGGRFRLLATGDSMIQIIDSFLSSRLKPKGARVTSDAHISTGISKPAMLNWPKHAASTARSLHPDVTVMFLGANDGFPLPSGSGKAPCCDAAWVASYAKRARGMMRSYLRGGSGRVYWLLLPTPRGSNFAMVFRAVNRAILRAATTFDPSEVRVLDLRRTFTPGGRFRQSIRYHGRTVSVRQGDGVHLNTKGASIAADLILRALRQDGFLG